MTIICDMVGAHFRPQEAKDIIKSLEVGDVLTLRRDPENAYDNFAVACDYQDEFLGFIPKEHNFEIATALDNGAEITAEIVAFANSLRPTLEIELPEEEDFEDD